MYFGEHSIYETRIQFCLVFEIFGQIFGGSRNLTSSGSVSNQLHFQAYPNIFKVSFMLSFVIATTQPTKQLKTTLVGVVLLSVKKKNHHHHVRCHYILSSSRQPRKLIFGMQPYFNPTR